MSSADDGAGERKPLNAAATNESSTVGRRSILSKKSAGGYGAGGESSSSGGGEGTPIEASPAPVTGFAAFDMRRKVLLLFLCIAGLLAALSVSILTPFFPREVCVVPVLSGNLQYVP